MDPTLPNRPQSDIPSDVEARYKEMQAELQRLTLSPEATAGESREARLEREDRLLAMRRQFDRMSQRPLSQRARQRTNITIALIAGLGVLLCIISLGGGVLLAGALSRPPDIAATASNFFSALETADYATAHSYVDPHIEAQTFATQAQAADSGLGSIVSAVKKAQVGGTSGAATGSATYLVKRKGGQLSDTKDDPTNTYLIQLDFTYNSSQGWLITNYSALFTLPQQPSS
jgi:hypothetical protein